MTIPRERVQADIAQRFPVEERHHILVTRLSDPEIEFLGPPDRIAVRMKVEATTPIVRTRGKFRVEGRIEYVEAEHAFFLRDPHVTHLHFEPPEGMSAVTGLLGRAGGHVRSEDLEDAARGVVEHALSTRPIYRLDASRSRREAKAIKHLESVRIRGDELVLNVHR